MRYGRSRHRPTKVFEFVKLILRPSKVAINTLLRYSIWSNSLLEKQSAIPSDQLKTVKELYDMGIHQKISLPDYQKLKTMVERSIDFDARNERIETGAVVTNRRVQRGVETGRGECYQWKAKGQCSRVDKCSFRHDENKRAKPTPKTAPPSEPPMYLFLTYQGMVSPEEREFDVDSGASMHMESRKDFNSAECKGV